MNGHFATRFPLFTPKDIEGLPDLEWLIAGILPTSAFALLYGEPGSYKSFVALSMALAVASGQCWLDRKSRKGCALYVIAEGVLGLKPRLQAYRYRREVNDDNIRFMASPISMMDSQEVEALLTALRPQKFEPSLIVVDTLARVTVGADENSAKEMGIAIAGLDLWRFATKATVLVIHHTRKDGLSERGSSVLRGAADVMIACEKFDPLGVKLRCAKMKDDEPFKEFGVLFEKVPLAAGKSSLVLGSIFEATAVSAHADEIVKILNEKFATKGTSHAELKRAFSAANVGSESTFDRAWRDLKYTTRVRIEKSGRSTLIFPTGVSVTPVSEQRQTRANGDVMSPPSEGGDTDTKVNGIAASPLSVVHLHGQPGTAAVSAGEASDPFLIIPPLLTGKDTQ